MPDENNQSESSLFSPEDSSVNEFESDNHHRSLIAEARMFSGPIPSPDILKEYDDIIPNGAERILVMAEKQQEHRIEREKYLSTADVNLSIRGQIFAFILALVGFGCATAAILTGHEIGGTFIGSIDIVALTTVFIYGKKREEKNSSVNIDK